MELEYCVLRLNAYVRGAPLPQCVEAMTIPNNDSTFDVYVNTNLCECKQHAALEHELRHIEKDRFYNETAKIQCIEAEADLISIKA